MYPTADHFAVAIVTACKLTGDQPIATCMRQASRGRHIAYGVLVDLFPEARKATIARLCGYGMGANAAAMLASARRSSWWLASHVEIVTEAVKAGRVPEGLVAVKP